MRYTNNSIRFALIILISVLVICWKVGTDYETSAAKAQIEIPSSEAELEENFSYLAATQFDRETEMTEPVHVDLSRAVDGYEITAGGQYRLTGELRGTLLINAPEQNVHLFLDNVSITSKFGPALYCQDASKLVITLMPNTENVISDSGSYHADTEVEACIYSECDLTINGTGALVVNGYYKDAIRSKDVTKVMDGTYTIKCKRTGIHGNDGVLISGGNLKISSEKYGIKTTKKGTEGRGDLVISGGELSVIAGRYAFVVTQADLLIYNCTVFDRSIVDTYDVGGRSNIQEGCVQS
ncbi:MAG: carbohydrate-binding domain-containing protein [Clostridia bacterium]|nr:carbohydrate-binding domain-containing protein [Clostridia bacterium]